MTKEEILDYVMDTPDNTNRMVLSDMLDEFSSGASLPTVTSDDNGDVLTVVEGAWAKAAPSSSGLVVTCTWEDDTGTLDKTWQEIYDVFSAGGQVVLGNSPQGDNVSIDSVYSVSAVSGTYYVHTMGSGGAMDFTASTANDYPSVED